MKSSYWHDGYADCVAGRDPSPPDNPVYAQEYLDGYAQAYAEGETPTD